MNKPYSSFSAILSFLFFTFMLFMVPAHSVDAHPFVQSGIVKSHHIPIACTKVTLFEAKKKRYDSRVLGHTSCDAHGKFTIQHKKPSSKNAVLYLIAEAAPLFGASTEKANSQVIHLATVLGQAPYPKNIVINERTTVATAYSMAQFIKGHRIGGPDIGLQNAAATVRNLVNIRNGNIGFTLKTSPNGEETSALPTMNSLANILAVCVSHAKSCELLFAMTTPPTESSSPHNTLDSIVNIAHFPGNKVEELLQFAQLKIAYTPALSPDAAIDPLNPNHINSWILALRYVGNGPNGQRLDGPGNIAFDSKGNAWVNNNYSFGSDPEEIRCGSTKVIKLTPTGHNAPGAPYGGNDQLQNGVHAGGLYGAGFGIAVDGNDNAWVTNFGFQGQLPPDDTSGQLPCPNNPDVLSVSASQFSSHGKAVSPDGDPSQNIPGGYRVLGEDTSGNTVDLLGQPQGIKVDRSGNVWIAGCVKGTITRFRGGNPNHIDHLAVEGLDKAFDITIDNKGHAWMTGNGTNNVVEMNKKFEQVGSLVTGFDRPMGIASDSAGNVWVAQAGLVSPPCPALLDPSGVIGDDGSQNTHAAVGLIQHKGNKRKVTQFGKGNDEHHRDGLRWPWGIAVDGNDNVWVANFAGQRIMQLCGAENAKCPGSLETGDPISPDSGYFNNGLVRITGIQIDPSGNVWMANNWLLEGFIKPQNPGGHQVVVFIGLAGPVKTPMSGPPQQP